MKSLFFLLTFFFTIFACSDTKDYDKRIVIKSLNIGTDKRAEWYHYSLISGYSLSYIELKNNSHKDIICKSGYVSDIYYSNDTLYIQFWKNDSSSFSGFHNYGIKIIKDTNGLQPIF